MNRVKARRVAFEMIFEYGFFNHGVEQILEVARECYEDLDDFSIQMLIACDSRLSEFDAVIEKNSIGWTVQRMSRVTAATLRLAVAELFSESDIPVSVTVNEAVEIAKVYEGEECSAFVNGVLGSVVKELPVKSEEISE